MQVCAKFLSVFVASYLFEKKKGKKKRIRLSFETMRILCRITNGQESSWYQRGSSISKDPRQWKRKINRLWEMGD